MTVQPGPTRSTPRRTRRLPRGRLLACAAAALLSCACAADPLGPEDLELVAVVPGVATAGPEAAQYLVDLRVSTPALPDVELWVPLPSSDRFQSVRSLSLEVGPPGTYDLLDVQGERTLHAAARDGGVTLSVRAWIERPPLAAAPAPAALADLPPQLDAAATVEAARRRGLEARVAYGLGSTGGDQPIRWAEVLLEGGWAAWDAGSRTCGLPPDRVRLGTEAVRARAGDRQVEASASYTLQRVEHD